MKTRSEEHHFRLSSNLNEPELFEELISRAKYQITVPFTMNTKKI